MPHLFAGGGGGKSQCDKFDVASKGDREIFGTDWQAAD